MTALQVPRRMIGTDAFQETPIVEVTRQITKHNYLVMDVHDIPRIMKEVLHPASPPGGCAPLHQCFPLIPTCPYLQAGCLVHTVHMWRMCILCHSGDRQTFLMPPLNAIMELEVLSGIGPGSHAAAHMVQAFYLARTGRPGPVLVDIPKDVQQSLAVPDWKTPMAIAGYMRRLPPPPLPSQLTAIVRALHEVGTRSGIVIHEPGILSARQATLLQVCHNRPKRHRLHSAASMSIPTGQ